MSASPHFKSMLPAQAEKFFASLGEKPFRARQALDWIYRRGARSWADMTDMPAPLRRRLDLEHPLAILELANEAAGADGTRKALFKAADGVSIEAVAMPRDRFLTVCVSSQAGCALGCVFCLTGREGFTRNLDASEIVEQVLAASALCGRTLPTHVVLMGMGEPLLNIEEVAWAVRVMTAQGAMGLSPSRITISTAGIPAGLRRLAAMGLKTGVALSLNATDDATRLRLMPAAGRHCIADVLAAFRTVPATVRNPRTIEYVLMAGVNDSAAQAMQLAKAALSVRAKVNLIPFNESALMEFKAPAESVIDTFLRVISGQGVTVTVRRSMGLDIQAACGQLAGKSAQCELGCGQQRVENSANKPAAN